MYDHIVSNMAFRKKSYRKKGKRTFKRKSYAKKAPLKKMVKAIMAKDVEIKSKQMTLVMANLYSSNSANFPLNVLVLGPNATTLAITQGVGQGNRVGNKITTKKLVFRGTIQPNPQNAVYNDQPRPLHVKMVIFYDREDPNAVPVPGSTFFQDGSSSTGFTTNSTDFLRAINTDRYRILKQKVFKLGYAAYTGTTANAANQGVNQGWINNDFKFSCPFNMDVTKLYPKQVKFNDNVSDPTTRGLYAFFFACYADGQSMTATQMPMHVNYIQDYRYSDA